jgi:hypothetical protein
MGWAALIIAGMAALVYLIWKSSLAATPLEAETPEPASSSLLASVVPAIEDAMGISRQSTIESLAKAIQKFEGWYPGSHSYRNNNPGNLRSGARMTGKDSSNYAVYATFANGWADLLDLLNKRAVQHPEWTLLDLFNSYAPASDNNDPNTYAKYVAQQTGLSVDTTLGEMA